MLCKQLRLDPYPAHLRRKLDNEGRDNNEHVDRVDSDAGVGACGNVENYRVDDVNELTLQLRLADQRVVIHQVFDAEQELEAPYQKVDYLQSRI